MTTSNYHTPVLLNECIEGLNIKPDGIYVDVTFGGGGHSKEIIKHLINGKLLAFDQDVEAQKNIISDNRFTFINANFTFLKNFLKLHNIDAVDGILADLGVSSHQFDAPERGFSTRFESILDARMNQNNPVTAQHILNTYDLENLKNIFKLYGELSNAYQIANAIVNFRINKEIQTTSDLKMAIDKLCPDFKQNKFLAQVFQALRIEVNNEIDVLKEFLAQTTEILAPKARLVVISYHSLEDRIVKNFMRSGNLKGEIKEDFYGNKQTPFKIITKKPIVPSDVELTINSRSKSAKLRISEKK